MNGKDLKEVCDPALTSLKEEFAREGGSPGLWEKVEAQFRELEKQYITQLEEQYLTDDKLHMLSEADLWEREELIRAQLQEIETIYATAPVGLAVLDTDLRYLRVNKMLADINGISATDHLRRTVRDVVPSLADQAEAIVLRILETREPVLNLEFSGETSAQPGVLRHWVEQWYPLHAPDGKIRAINVVVEEVTKQKRIEGELRKSEKRFRSLVNNLTEGVWVVDEHADTLFVNPQMAEMLGYAVNEMKGRNLGMFLDPESRMKLSEDNFRRLKMPRQLEDRIFIRKDGRRICALISTSPFIDENENFQGVIAGVLDITERKRAEEEMRETKEYLENLITYANAPIIVWDKNLQITRFNQAFERLTGRSESEMIGQHLRTLFPAATADYSLMSIQDTLGGERWEIVEIPIIGADGTTRTVLWNSASIFNPDGSLRAVIAQGYDITERKQAEEALERYADDLRTSNKDLEQFAYIASHDLQEPLRTVVSYSQLLKRRYGNKLGEDADEFIGFIVDAGTRMQAQILDLLEYSRVSTRGQEMARVESEMILEEAVKNLQARIRRSGAVINHDPLPTVLADATQLQQLLQNLLSNAIKFSKKDTVPEIHISAKSLGDRWQFSVRDNGIGIDSQFQERIFVIFQRLHTLKEYPGTGIGLAICKRIIDRHGGEIWVEAEPGVGSTFHFTLPVAN
jgi:PAS domain S-box-containing protein